MKQSGGYNSMYNSIKKSILAAGAAFGILTIGYGADANSHAKR